MKVGDLVVMPGAVERHFSLLRQDLGVGLIVDNKIVRNIIGVLWSDGDGTVDYEPVKWLKVINEAR